ncbi:tRNA(His) guanylyltransferase Thg1 family protein [Candidatus Methanocrinis natronophilus]|uniref:tRNA(His) guanylyltransferase n=1 Tax=Candidatus Methanocrinis natronophilus TaxID=3033396 RepID=A0ABT5X6X1_9EURY|nr:tRNA(His) guanylyltransferase Thg1 family protein [Candidatus Methanocrinis natronophilus]MDF0590454.1 tRNA(His) guanylyltransferase Thg1 family protein [Candidatus Methanocrinis natronophilus]
MRRRTDSWEVYADLRVRGPLVVRADGRGFGKLLRDAEKPYDIKFATAMAEASRIFVEGSGLSPALAFTFSDEINLLFAVAPFRGRLEKIDSVVAASLSGHLSIGLGRAVAMDARAIPLCSGEICEYLAERQDEAWRNHVFSSGFYALIDDGLAPRDAMGRLLGMKEADIHEMLFQRGVNLAKSPPWQRRGILIHRIEGGDEEEDLAGGVRMAREKEMGDEREGEKGGERGERRRRIRGLVEGERRITRRIVEEWEPPLFRSEEGKTLLEGTICGR